ncbi:hypothetical protein [Paraburkholderia terrae]|jgi:hypothetical protein|uniref:hypothetical protein n=1 Tax=Paraburkholderia TaxID=1822464 RepID=UPI001EE27051|nr:hypothetical protein [Paraburkholderia terrae]BEU27229.1 hypothetical protein PBP221_73690 [Paraburkholderia sp. 22B1P]GJH01139.1 hypothetical protein CBA19C8_11300 [Paraburkholderia terrae]
MSMNLASFYRQAVFHPFNAVRQRWQARPVDAAATQSPPDAGERLERIAVYARAGYFNMGYTFEMFHVIGEIAPD